MDVNEGEAFVKIQIVFVFFVFFGGGGRGVGGGPVGGVVLGGVRVDGEWRSEAFVLFCFYCGLTSR